MCLIAFAWQTDPARPLLLIANRDEFMDRPAAPLAYWDDAPDIAAGRDLRERGTWLGLSRTGRVAAVTNVRDPRDLARYPRSRGSLTAGFLGGQGSAADYAAALMPAAADYGGFNLLLWDGAELIYASNRPRPQWRRVDPGFHGLSNAQLDTPWPKTVWARQQIEEWVASGQTDGDRLIEAMRSRQVAPDAQLPDTGVGIEAERVLAPAFIHRPGYGTRCTTWLQIGADGQALIHERRYDAQMQPTGDTVLDVPLRCSR